LFTFASCLNGYQIYFHQNKRRPDRLYETGGSRTKKTIESVSNKFLIVGLGNIGAEYVNTRQHRIQNIDHFAKELSFQTVKLGVLAEYKFKGRPFF
jgi:PTH1 family peptidyl-tRNA hydrolase